MKRFARKIKIKTTEEEEVTADVKASKQTEEEEATADVKSSRQTEEEEATADVKASNQTEEEEAFADVKIIKPERSIYERRKISKYRKMGKKYEKDEKEFRQK